MTAKRTSDGVVLGSYKYDALGRRVQKVTAEGTRTYVLSGAQVVQEYLGTVLDRSYVYGTYVDEVLVQVKGGEKAYFHTNHLYSTAVLTNSAGAVVERYGYDAYGKRVTLNPDGSLKTGNAATVVGFTGRTLDAETGLVYFRTRYYSPILGSFISRDSMRYIDGLGLYRSYFIPNYLDSNGQWLHIGIGVLGGAIVGGLVAAFTGGDVMAGVAGGAVAGGVLAMTGNPALAGAVGGAVQGLVSGVNTVAKHDSLCKASFTAQASYVALNTVINTGTGWAGGWIGGQFTGWIPNQWILNHGQWEMKLSASIVAEFKNSIVIANLEFFANGSQLVLELIPTAMDQADQGTLHQRILLEQRMGSIIDQSIISIPKECPTCPDKN